jgi:hypothetical protein
VASLTHNSREIIYYSKIFIKQDTDVTSNLNVKKSLNLKNKIYLTFLKSPYSL